MDSSAFGTGLASGFWTFVFIVAVVVGTIAFGAGYGCHRSNAADRDCHARGGDYVTVDQRCVRLVEVDGGSR